MSRRQIFSKEVKHLLEKKKNLELLKKINSVYSSISDENEALLLKETKKNYAKVVKGSWK